MALHQFYTFTGTNQFISDLNDFALANGWSVDFFGLYNSNNRIHVHKGSNHFEAWYNSTTVVNLNGCSGYSSGSAPSSQPGVSGTKALGSLAAGSLYCFVSCGTTMYLGSTAAGAAGAWSWVILGEILAADKIGTWAGGQLVGSRPSSGLIFSSVWDLTSQASGQMFYNGSWTPNSSNAIAGAVAGNGSETELIKKQPCTYNGGILPVRVKLWVRNTTTPSLLHPVGYAPGLYRVNGGDIYSVGEIIPINGVDHLIMPNWDSTLGNAAYHDLLFALS